MEQTKLTVRLHRDLLEGAKQYAREHDTTLTRLVSEYLRQLGAGTSVCPARRPWGDWPVPCLRTPRWTTIATTWKKSMAPKLKVLFDLNVVLDVLQKREPFYTASAQALAGAEVGLVEGCVAAHSLTTLFYLLARYESAEQARVTLADLLNIVSVAAVDQTVIERALALPYQDFEDAVQMMAAVRMGADYLVTRNVRDYQAGPLPVIQPAELLALI